MGGFSKNAQLLGYLLEQIGAAGHTRLIKLLYLADLESRRLRGRPVSELRFQFHHHGPFDRAFYDALGELEGRQLIAEKIVHYPSGKYERQVEARAAVPQHLDAVDRHILTQICRAYGRMPLDDLLAIVYDSAPMKNLERGKRVPMENENNKDRAEIGFDIEELVAAQQDAERGNYVTGAEFFDALRAKIAARG